MKLKSTRIFLLAFLLLGLLQCQTTIIHFQPGGGGIPGKPPELSQTYGSVGLGIIEVSKPADLPCARSPGTVVITRKPIDVLIHFFAGIAWAPWRVELYCQ